MKWLPASAALLCAAPSLGNDTYYSCRDFLWLHSHSPELAQAFSDGFYIGVTNTLKGMHKAQPGTTSRLLFFYRLLDLCDEYQDRTLDQIAVEAGSAN